MRVINTAADFHDRILNTEPIKFNVHKCLVFTRKGVSKVNFTPSIMCLGGVFENHCSIRDLMKLKKKYAISAYYSQLGWMYLIHTALAACLLPPLCSNYYLISGSTKSVRSKSNLSFKISLQKPVTDVTDATSMFFQQCIRAAQLSHKQFKSFSRTPQLDAFWPEYRSVSALLSLMSCSFSIFAATHNYNRVLWKKIGKHTASECYAVACSWLSVWPLWSGWSCPKTTTEEHKTGILPTTGTWKTFCKEEYAGSTNIIDNLSSILTLSL